MIVLDKVSKSFGGKALFTDVSWQLPAGAAIGLVGPNGAGKTTLFRLLIGEEVADTGEVIVPKGVQIGHLAQEVPTEMEGTLLDVVLAGRSDLLEMEVELHQLSEALAKGEDSEAVVNRYSDLQDQFRREGGYELRSRAAQIAAGLGFRDEDHHKEFTLFSGGWRMRALLAKLLLQRPDLLLLDEPTNHLDLESIEWLEQFLGDYEGTILVISHDRFFLNRLVTKVIELHGGSLSIYNGDYDHYLEAREEHRERLIAEAEAQKKEIARVEEFVERFRYKASKAAQVQSRVKQLEKITLISVPPAYDREIGFQFPEPPRIGKVVMDARGLAKSYGENRVYEDLSFQLSRGEHVAFVGPNGAGKSTLLKMLAGVLEPDKGEIQLGHKVEVTYFAQHSVDQLDLSRTVLEEMDASASIEATPRIRSILGAFLFTGDDVHKKISVLSGGEKSRLALAKMLLEPAGCLLLDEPTNHLDIPSRRVLEHALREFQGAFCVISHDRYFLNEVVNRVVHIEDGRSADYPGTYEEYRWRRRREESAEKEHEEKHHSATEDSFGNHSRKDLRRLKAEIRKERDAEVGGLRKKVQELEAEIEVLEEKVAELEDRLGQPETYSELSGEAIAQLQRKHGGCKEKLMATMEEWEQAGIVLDEIDKKYAAREAALEDS